MALFSDFGKKRELPAPEHKMSKQDRGYSSSETTTTMGYFKSTPFLETGSTGYRKQNRDGLHDDCHKYYGAVKSQNDNHNGKIVDTACERSILLYEELMEDGLKVKYRDDGTMDDKEVQSLHDYAMQLALDRFQSTARLAPEHVSRDCRDRIMDKCKTRFDAILAENEERNKQAIERAKLKSFQKYKAYVDAIIKVRREIGEMIGETELKRVHEEAMRAAMGTFDVSSMIGGGPNAHKEIDSRAIEWWQH